MTSDHQIRTILDSLMYNLGLVAQSIVNEMNLPDEKTKAITYIRIVTNLVNNVSGLMKELNKLGVENIKRKYSLKEKAPDNKGIII